MKKLYFGSNLKMYKGISATREYLQKLVENTKDISRDDIELFIIPSYTTLQTATSCCDREFVRLGAQNMCWEDQGQFTGEISPCMLEEMGLDLVMIGHSERRHVFGESDVEENKKVKAALSHGENYFAVLDGQHRLMACLKLGMNLDNLVIAEPLNVEMSIVALIA